MGMLKDIYHVGQYSTQMNNVIPHCIQSVNCIWVVQTEKDADIFKEELRECEANSKLPQFPPLNVTIYITKEKVRNRGYISGRPDFNRVFGDLTLVHGDKTMLVFACGPSAMVKQVWDQSLERIGDGVNVDFHREIFEF
jgi:NAD(P)H-flavin reductase